MLLVGPPPEFSCLDSFPEFISQLGTVNPE
ncbi:hypothetical protein SAMN04487960_103260 [Marinobacter mobilis]|uniref:Uncharacterized protein n=1 Tax=Marinobacter mobilis TaxID=488533 RepID=A0A1H2UXT3_9GAMM|nr:hypothetical protein SAMN04487960_103260 [Marinobacter mobilis]